jgi:hypothetical protein
LMARRDGVVQEFLDHGWVVTGRLTETR